VETCLAVAGVKRAVRLKCTSQVCVILCVLSKEHARKQFIVQMNSMKIVKDSFWRKISRCDSSGLTDV